MPTVHKAVFGEAKGAHDLIVASLGAPDDVLAELAARYTDRLLPTQILWDAYLCGFPVRNSYVVTRTFPVKGTRSGMVQTHAAIAPLDAVENLALDSLLKLLPVEPESPVQEPSTVEISEFEVKNLTNGVMPPGYASSVRLLLNGQVPIWLGQNGFEEIIKYLWQRLWPEARRDFRFRISAEPNDLLDLPATFVCTPTDLRSGWKPQQFVDLNLLLLPDPSLSESYLLGLPEGDAFGNLRGRLGVFPAQLVGLKRLEQYAQMLAENTADSIRAAVRLMRVMFPEPSQCKTEKASLFNSLTQKTIDGNEQDVLALRNLDVSAYLDGQWSLQKIIFEWLRKRVAQGTGGVSVARSILLENHPWKLIADKALAETFAFWTPIHARLLWNWWVSDSRFIAPSEFLLPEHSKSAEDDLRLSLPMDVPPLSRSEVLQLCSRRRFLSLSSSILSAAHDLAPVEKFRAQLEIIADDVQLTGLPEIANGLSKRQIVDAALVIQDVRITELAGSAVKDEPELLNSMDVHNPGWRAIWISALEKGHELFHGISQPSLAAHGVFDERLAGSVIQPVLLEKLATNPSSGLIEYANRRELWDFLSATTRQESIATAAEEWLTRFSNDRQLSDFPLEPELEENIIALWRSSPGRLNPVALLEFWHRFQPALGEADFQKWLSMYDAQLTPLEAIGIGKFIHDNHWDRAADEVIRRAKFTRRDLLPTVHQLWNKVGMWDKFHFAVFTSEPVVEEDEWWEAFEQLSVDLYPLGIQQHDIWAHADGDESRVKQGTGREQWSDALDLLRKGGAGGSMTVEGLLHEMRKDYFQNQKLQLLEDVYKTKRKW